MRAGWLFVIFLFFHNTIGIDLNVKTIYGNITGTTSRSGLYKVWNTRYAQSPAGANRWKSPIPLIPWNDTIDATETPPICIQFGGITGSVPANKSEDCLFLSVYVPINHTLDNDPLPVQIFVHGGSFLTGGARYYSGEVLGGNDLIFVSINYRLGALGFLAHPALYTPENGEGIGFYGIQDQRAAFQWVQDNIQFFGGDKSKVTISGESAGAISVCIHLALPKSNGLFHQGIMESGCCNCLQTNETSFAAGQTIADAVNCTNSSDVLACLVAADASALYTASLSATVSLASPELTQQPIDVIKSRSGPDVPLLVGTNKDEYSLFVCKTYANVTEQGYQYSISVYFPTQVKFILEAYPVSSYTAPVHALIDVWSDYIFKCPTKALADTSSSPVYMYSFHNQPSYFLESQITQEVLGIPDVDCLGASHAFELPYLFDIFDVLADLHLNSSELDLRTTMRNAWASFVTTGVPNLPSFAWPLYNTSRENFVFLDVGNVSVDSQFRTSFCDFWNSPPITTTTTSTSLSSSTSSTSSGTITSGTSTHNATSSSTSPASSTKASLQIPFLGFILLFVATIYFQ